MDDYVTKADLNAAMLRVDERFSKLESGYGEMRGEIAEIRDGMRRLGEQQQQQQETNRQVLGALETQQGMLERQQGMLERQQAVLEALVQTAGTQQAVTESLVQTVAKMQESLAEMREESAETRGELKVLGPALSEKFDAWREATEHLIERQMLEMRRENEQALAELRLELEQGLAGVRLDQERGRTFAHRIAATYAGASVAVVSAVAGALRAFG